MTRHALIGWTCATHGEQDDAIILANRAYCPHEGCSARVSPRRTRPGSWKQQAQARTDAQFPPRNRPGRGWHNLPAGCRDHIRGETHPDAKLTAEMVLEFRRRHAAGEGICALAREAPVSRPTLSAAIRGTTWAHLGDSTAC